MVLLFAGSTACQSPPPTRTATVIAATQSFGIPTLGQCHGLPRVDLRHTEPHIDCVALLDDDLTFPRSVATRQGQIYVVDKGAHLFARDQGWGQGRVLQYTADDAGGYRRAVIADGLDHPSGLALDSHGRIYVSTTHQVLRVHPSKPPKVVIDNLPTHGWHYLTALHIHNQHLYVTVPSATDHCETGNGNQVQQPCLEVSARTPKQQQTAVIRRYEIARNGNVGQDFSIAARGLRDALAMGTHPSTERIFVADNGWDQVDLNETQLSPEQTPPDELNVIPRKQAADFGWPYCYGNGKTTPPYEAAAPDCSEYKPPIRLLPPHSAPLGLLLSKGTLWLNLHGFAATGSRTMFSTLDSEGNLATPWQTLVHWDYRHRAGFAVGRPFGISQLSAQTLLVTDDWNHGLMLVYLNHR